MQTLDLSKFEEELKEFFEDAAEDIVETTEEILDEASSSLIVRLHRTSPFETGEYRDGWVETRESRVGGTVRVIKNDNKPQLTHLLEYGRQGAKAIPHIRPGLVAVMEELDKKLERGR